MTLQRTTPIWFLLVAAVCSLWGCTRRYKDIDETFRCYRKDEYSVVIKKERIVMSEGLSPTANYLKESVAEWWLVTWNLRDLRDGEQRVPTSVRKLGQRSRKGIDQGLYGVRFVNDGIDWDSLLAIASDGTLIRVEGHDRSGRSGGDLVSYSWVEGEPRSTAVKMTMPPGGDVLVGQDGAVMLLLGTPSRIVELPSLKSHRFLTNLAGPEMFLDRRTAALSAGGDFVAFARDGNAISAEVYDVRSENVVRRVHDDSAFALITTHCAGTNISYVAKRLHNGASASFRGRAVELPPEVTAALSNSAKAHFDEDGTELIIIDAFRNESLRLGVRCFRIAEQQTNAIRTTLQLDAATLKALTP